MLAYRIARSNFIRDLSGQGAFLYGGRWNSKGIRVLYLAESASLALLEVLVHIPNYEIDASFSMLTVDLPEATFANLPPLPQNWRQTPAPIELQSVGNQFVSKAENFLLKVPSVIMPVNFNILVNPTHRDFKDIKIVEAEKIELEKRLFASSKAG